MMASLRANRSGRHDELTLVTRLARHRPPRSPQSTLAPAASPPASQALCTALQIPHRPVHHARGVPTYCAVAPSRGRRTHATDSKAIQPSSGVLKQLRRYSARTPRYELRAEVVDVVACEGKHIPFARKMRAAPGQAHQHQAGRSRR